MGNQASSPSNSTAVGHIDIHDIPDASPFPNDSDRHGSNRSESATPRTASSINESRESEPPSPARLRLVTPVPGSPNAKKQRGGAYLTLAIDDEAGNDPTGAKTPPYSPRNDAQLGGYPPDCGTAEHKYLSYAKVRHERGQTHPMSFSMTEVDAVGNPVPEKYPLSIDFGAHAFHRLPTDSFVLSQYGVAMTLYFKYLKVMAWLFFLLVVLSAPALLVYTAGGAQSLDEFKMLAKQNLPAVLGMTTVGHLKDSSSVCDQVIQGNALSLACPAGEIGFVKAVYSDHDAQGSCTCPEINKVAEGNGQCRGKPVRTCTNGTCTSTCGAEDYGCFLGVHPVSKWACCASSLDADTQKPSFDSMRIRSTPGCGSESIEAIVNGLCLGKKSCSFNVSEALSYKWKIDETTGATCPSEKYTTGEYCEMMIQDESDLSQCGVDALRGLIVYARCFTTRIDLSKEWSLQIIGWDSISRKDFLGLAVGCDIACSVCFFFVVLWMQRKEKENVARISKDQIKAMDYTVQLMHVPSHDNVEELRQDLKSHLETLLSDAPKFASDVERIRIADIQFGKRTSGHLELLRERGTVVRKLEVAQQRLEKVKLLQSRLAPWNYNLKLKRATLAQQGAGSNAGGGDVMAITAFITFEEEEGFHRCLAEYPDLGFLYRLFQPAHKRLHGKRLRFRPAPDPTDIVWENLHHPYIERLLRQVIVALVTLAVLFVSFILILLAKLQKTRLERQFGRPSNCPVGVTKEDVVDDEIQKQIGLVPYKALVECYCKSVLVEHSYGYMTREKFYNPTTQSDHLYCKTWATSFISTQALSVFSVFMVVCVNVLLARILNTLVAMEKHHTQSGQVVSRITKVFLAQFCNTAILLMIINANLEYFLGDANSASTTGFGLGSLSILNGKYSDFSPGWYTDVGVSLMLTMVVNTFSPHVYVVMNYLLLKWKRYSDRGYSSDFSLTKQDTQRDLEALYRGPPFDLAARYAQSLTSIFITYLFSAGMPLLHFVGFLEMLMTYWADKFTFLRIARSPPLYDAKVATAAGSLLPYAVGLHSLVAMWMFSNEMIFQSPSDILEQLSNEDVIVGEGIPSFNVERGQIFGRITRPQVVVLFGFFVAFAAVLIVRVVLFVYFPSFVKSFCPVLTRFTQETKVAKGIPNYFDAMPTNILREKITAMHIKDSLRAKYAEALTRREEAVAKADSPRKSPRRRTRRSISAAEHYLDQKWIVGCPSYAIQDNKEYVDQLAIDSYLSEGVPLDRIF